MGTICPCLCPRRREQGNLAYDVHEETFEMDDNLEIHQHSPKHSDQNNNILTDDLKSSEENLIVSTAIEMVAHSADRQNENSIQKTQKHILSVSFDQQEDNLQHHKRNIDEQEHLVSAQKMQKQPKSQEKQSLLIKKIQDQQQQNQSRHLENQMKQQSNAGVMKAEQIIQNPTVQSLIQQKPILQKPKNPNILNSKPIKKKYNPEDYRFANLKNQSLLLKKPNSIKEQQFNIQNCQNCTIYIVDITANLYIDDCVNCNIYIAPCESTIFIRNCKGLYVSAATKQFRTYECHASTFALYCKSQPVIESSSQLRFTSFLAPCYDGLEHQFMKIKLQMWNNHWSQIHNFTKKENEVHYTLHHPSVLSQETLFQNNFSQWQTVLKECSLDVVSQDCFIPLIYGELQLSHEIHKVKEILLLLEVGKVDQNQVRDLLRNTIIFRAVQGILVGANQGEITQSNHKQQSIAILIGVTNEEEEEILVKSFKQIDTIIYSNQTDVSNYKNKWFMNFKDERESK